MATAGGSGHSASWKEKPERLLNTLQWGDSPPTKTLSFKMPTVLRVRTWAIVGTGDRGGGRRS